MKLTYLTTAVALATLGACASAQPLTSQAQENTTIGVTTMDAQSQKSFDTVMAFMDAMGKGEMDKMNALMADDMVWQNEGDANLPWIGPWTGKQAVLGFLPIFGENFQTTEWQSTDAFASGDTVAVFGKMNGNTTKSGQEIGEFHFALRAKVRDGQVILWNWFEDSYAVSKAYHGD